MFEGLRPAIGLRFRGYFISFQVIRLVTWNQVTANHLEPGNPVPMMFALGRISIAMMFGTTTLFLVVWGFQELMLLYL